MAETRCWRSGRGRKISLQVLTPESQGCILYILAARRAFETGSGEDRGAATAPDKTRELFENQGLEKVSRPTGGEHYVSSS